MPLPIAHGLLGASAVAAIRPGSQDGIPWKPLFWGAVLGIAPDLDFIGLWVFEWENAHRTFTHSFLFTGLMAAFFFAWHGRKRWRVALAYTAALSMHWIADFATTDATEGVQLLWPFSTQSFKLGLFSLLEIDQGFESMGALMRYLPELLKVSALELALFLPVLVFLIARMRRRSDGDGRARKDVGAQSAGDGTSGIAHDEVVALSMPQAHDGVVNPADKPPAGKADYEAVEQSDEAASNGHGIAG